MNHDFRTIVPVEDNAVRLDHSQQVITLGSCFSDEVGKKLEEAGFDCLVNPFGVIFHPLPISALLLRMIDSRTFTEKDLRKNSGVWSCFETHGKYNSSNRIDTLTKLNETLAVAHQKLQRCSWLFITLGTAWGYGLVDSDSIVANCHRFPQQDFEKELVPHEHIEKELKGVLYKLKTINPNIKIVVTVSPVRHWKDGATQNSLSKSHLRIAADSLCRQSGDIHYFPAYELVLDDLRDYRFTKEDMLHPNAQAVNYVWDNFKKWSMDESTIQRAKEFEGISRQLKHQPRSKEEQDRQAQLREEFRLKMTQNV